MGLDIFRYCTLEGTPAASGVASPEKLVVLKFGNEAAEGN